MLYLKTILYEFILTIILLLINSILTYFNIQINNNILYCIIYIFTGIYISKLSNKKYYIEGLKISVINIILFSIFTLIFKSKFNIIYYLFIFILTIFGCFIGKFFKIKK